MFAFNITTFIIANQKYLLANHFKSFKSFQSFKSFKSIYYEKLGLIISEYLFLNNNL